MGEQWDLPQDEFRKLIEKLDSDDLSRIYENLSRDDKTEFIRALAASAKERNRIHAEISSAIAKVESFGGWNVYPDTRRGVIPAPQSNNERSEARNVTQVTQDVTPQSVTLVTPMNRHNVTVASTIVTPIVIHSGPAIRAKRGEDGLFHCRECDYITERAGTLRMHRFRKHRMIESDGK